MDEEISTIFEKNNDTDCESKDDFTLQVDMSEDGSNETFQAGANRKTKDDYEADVPKEESCSEFGDEMKMSDDCEENDDEEDVDDDLYFNDSDTENSYLNNCSKGGEQPKERRKPLGFYKGKVELELKCEWKNCAFESNEDSEFHVHVSYHIPDVEIKTLGNGEEVYMCLWSECSYITGGVSEIQRHVTYHSYHTRLKQLGKKLVKEWDLPKCMYGSETRNDVPDKINRMICEWSDCHKEFVNVQVFLHHIQTHVNECFVDFGVKSGKVKCQWKGCTLRTVMSKPTRLSDHLRSHTKEKVVACPNCGALFSTNTKLLDHCKRQLPTDMSEFQCSHCYKHFSTLRLLKDHMRGHVNFYKCCYCDMTCTSRHTFSAHIRYKHLDSKPFQCNQCDYMCKTQFDLKAHLASHDSKAFYGCMEEGCEFTCRQKRTLQRHMVNDHKVSSSPVYRCHMPDCKSQYKRGQYLTKHLMTKHCLRWPSGHSKFMYHRQEDGTYKLQTVRYESLKLFGENMSSSPSKSTSKPLPEQAHKSKSFKVSTIEPDSNNGMSQVYISIEDESGNTINSCTAPEVIGDTIPKNATVIATADIDDS